TVPLSAPQMSHIRSSPIARTSYSVIPPPPYKAALMNTDTGCTGGARSCIMKVVSLGDAPGLDVEAVRGGGWRERVQ
ncbi:MAG: hypothetical protein IJ702_05995, partial [Fretibacterium sp.]|nr:hypothetical protein [Fretibacterium sp.]